MLVYYIFFNSCFVVLLFVVLCGAGCSAYFVVLRLIQEANDDDAFLYINSGLIYSQIV